MASHIYTFMYNAFMPTRIEAAHSHLNTYTRATKNKIKMKWEKNEVEIKRLQMWASKRMSCKEYNKKEEQKKKMTTNIRLFDMKWIRENETVKRSKRSGTHIYTHIFFSSSSFVQCQCVSMYLRFTIDRHTHTQQYLLSLLIWQSA